jgi:CcmD family protein
MTCRRLGTALMSIVLLASQVRAMQPPPGQSEFVPINELPPGDQLPAAPLLIAAYAFVWLGTMFYVWTVWRRLNRVETEMRALGQKAPRR